MEAKKEVKKIHFAKGGSGGESARVTLPKEFIEALGLSKEKPYILLEQKGKKITITKEEK